MKMRLFDPATHSFIAHSEDIRCSRTVRPKSVVILSLGKCPAAFLENDRYRVFRRSAELVGPIPYEFTIFFVQVGKIVWLLQREHLRDLPEVRQGCKERTGELGQRMEEALIDDIVYSV